MLLLLAEDSGISRQTSALIWQVASSKKRVLSSQISWQEDLNWCVCACSTT